MKKSEIFETILEAISVSIQVSNNKGNISVTHKQPRPVSCDIVLPTNPSLGEEQIMVNVADIAHLRTEHDWDYFLILDMYDGREIKIKYSFSSNRKKDVDKILKLRGVNARSSFRFSTDNIRYAF